MFKIGDKAKIIMTGKMVTIVEKPKKRGLTGTLTKYYAVHEGERMSKNFYTEKEMVKVVE